MANLYGVGGCPTTVFARAGGRVATTKLGNLTEDQLRRLGDAGRGLMELQLAEGWVEAELAEEFPELGLVHAPLEARPAQDPARGEAAACARWPTATRAAR